MKIFCRRIIVNDRSNLRKRGPLLLACNHPNSFLDAIILDILFEQPVWSLARGDAFQNKFIGKLLSALKILPVYRSTEGAEHLHRNYGTFDACKELFRQNAIISIFSEGKCINEWHLRPLKKGTARLAISTWEEEIPLEVLPVGINYSSFRRFGKNVIVNFGSVITFSDIPWKASEGIRHQFFNRQLQDQLEKLVYSIDKDAVLRKQALLEKKPSRLRKSVLLMPGILGWLLHFPLYLPVQKYIYKKTAHNDHYDSIIAATLLFFYPIYLSAIVLWVLYITKSYYTLLLLLLFPFAAWSYVQVKPQLDK